MEAARRPGFAPGYNPSPIDFDHPLDYRLVDGEHDVLGDGSVILFPTFGHTPGHQSLRVRAGQGPGPGLRRRRLLHAGEHGSRRAAAHPVERPDHARVARHPAAPARPGRAPPSSSATTPRSGRPRRRPPPPSPSPRPPVLTTLLDGLTFTEGPRWHDGRLWFSDFYTQRVLAVDSGRPRRDHRWRSRSGPPASAGCRTARCSWSPCSTAACCAWRAARPACSTPISPSIADRARATTWWWTRRGRAYVGNFGFDRHKRRAAARPRAWRASTRTAASRAPPRTSAFPNGTVITPDGRTLIVGETHGPSAHRLRRGRRRRAERTGASGPQLDGASSPTASASTPRARSGSPTRAAPTLLRVREGGTIERRHPDRAPGATPSPACWAAPTAAPSTSAPAPAAGRPWPTSATARIETVRVDVPGAGLP